MSLSGPVSIEAAELAELEHIRDLARELATAVLQFPRSVPRSRFPPEEWAERVGYLAAAVLQTIDSDALSQVIRELCPGGAPA